MRTMTPAMTPVSSCQGPYRIVANRRCELDGLTRGRNMRAKHEDRTRTHLYKAISMSRWDHVRGSEDVPGIPKSICGEMNEYH